MEIFWELVLIGFPGPPWWVLFPYPIPRWEPGSVRMPDGNTPFLPGRK